VHYGEVLVDKSAIDLILMVLDYIVTVSFEYIFYCDCFHLYCGCFKLFCNVWVCMCGFCNVWACMCAFCNVWVCMCGFCNVWVCMCGLCKVWVRMCGFCKVWVRMCGFCKVWGRMCGFCNVWVCMYGFCNVCVLVICIPALFGYPDRGFSVLFPQLEGKCQGITRQEGARPALLVQLCSKLIRSQQRDISLPFSCV
jgi:hypothetical protein